MQGWFNIFTFFILQWLNQFHLVTFIIVLGDDFLLLEEFDFSGCDRRKSLLQEIMKCLSVKEIWDQMFISTQHEECSRDHRHIFLFQIPPSYCRSLDVEILMDKFREQFFQLVEVRHIDLYGIKPINLYNGCSWLWIRFWQSSTNHYKFQIKFYFEKLKCNLHLWSEVMTLSTSMLENIALNGFGFS